MWEKLEIARKLRISSITSKNCSKLFFKIYLAYVRDCIIRGKDKFNLNFRGKSIYGLRERFFNWAKYYIDVVYKFILVNIIHPNVNNLSTHEYELLYNDVTPPAYVKVTTIPSKYVLHNFLEANGFEIENEFLMTTFTSYTIKRKDM